MSYTLKLIDKEISLSDSEGQTIKTVLQRGNTKWLELGEDLINTSQVMGVYYSKEPEKFKRIEAPVTKIEIENRVKTLAMIRQKLNY